MGIMTWSPEPKPGKLPETLIPNQEPETEKIRREAHPERLFLRREENPKQALTEAEKKFEEALVDFSSPEMSYRSPALRGAALGGALVEIYEKANSLRSSVERNVYQKKLGTFHKAIKQAFVRGKSGDELYASEFEAENFINGFIGEFAAGLTLNAINDNLDKQIDVEHALTYEDVQRASDFFVYPEGIEKYEAGDRTPALALQVKSLALSERGAENNQIFYKIRTSGELKELEDFLTNPENHQSKTRSDEMAKLLNRLAVLQSYSEKLDDVPVIMVLSGAKSFNPGFHEITGMPSEEFIERATAAFGNLKIDKNQ